MTSPQPLVLYERPGRLRPGEFGDSSGRAACPASLTRSVARALHGVTHGRFCERSERSAGSGVETSVTRLASKRNSSSSTGSSGQGSGRMIQTPRRKTMALRRGNRRTRLATASERRKAQESGLAAPTYVYMDTGAPATGTATSDCASGSSSYDSGGSSGFSDSGSSSSCDGGSF